MIIRLFDSMAENVCNRLSLSRLFVCLLSCLLSCLFLSVCLMEEEDILLVSACESCLFLFFVVADEEEEEEEEDDDDEDELDSFSSATLVSWLFASCA